MQRILLSSLVAIVLLTTACGQKQMIKDSWKFTTRQYRTYLNTPASLDLEDKGSCEIYELALGEAVLNVDAEIEKLIRAMENSDHNPDQNWVMGMMGRLPWLSGVALVDESGRVVAQYPELHASPLDPSPLLEPDPKQRMGDLRAYVRQADNGAEIYIANPVYGGESMRGLIIAYFDPRNLVLMSPNPNSFVLASPAGVLWPGAYGAQGSIVGSQDWRTLLTKSSCGIIGDSKTGFFWTTRYLGNLPLVYAMPVSAGQGQLPAAAPAAEPSAVTPPVATSAGDRAEAVAPPPPPPSTQQYIHFDSPAPLSTLPVPASRQGGSAGGSAAGQ